MRICDNSNLVGKYAQQRRERKNIFVRFIELKKNAIKRDAYEEIYEQLDEGVCSMCEHRYDGCAKVCYKNDWEMETFKKWLKGKCNE